jgi:hypothetical protein
MTHIIACSKKYFDPENNNKPVAVAAMTSQQVAPWAEPSCIGTASDAAQVMADCLNSPQVAMQSVRISYD